MRWNAPSASLAARLGMDPTVLREKNMVREGQQMPTYYDEPLLQLHPGPVHGEGKRDDPLGRQVSPRRLLPNGHIRSVG